MSILGSVRGMEDTQKVSLTALQITALIKGWQQELAERARDGDPYNEGYMDALDRCIQALKLLDR
jgi:hypothetical protein